jgi:hypothetical protein
MIHNKEDFFLFLGRFRLLQPWNILPNKKDAAHIKTDVGIVIVFGMIWFIIYFNIL